MTSRKRSVPTLRQAMEAAWDAPLAERGKAARLVADGMIYDAKNERWEKRR